MTGNCMQMVYRLFLNSLSPPCPFTEDGIWSPYQQVECQNSLLHNALLFSSLCPSFVCYTDFGAQLNKSLFHKQYKEIRRCHSNYLFVLVVRTDSSFSTQQGIEKRVQMLIT